MSDELLNDSLAFITYPYQRAVIGLKATGVESATGTQQFIQHTDHDRRRFVLNLNGFERSERETIKDFYLARAGIVDDFLFEDYEDFVVRNTIGTGTGSQTVFQLKQVVGTQEFDRWDIQDTPQAIAAPKFWINSVLQVSGYTVAFVEDGRVTFATPPPLGELVEAEFYYLRRCRFIVQYQDFETNYEWLNVQLSFDEKVVTP
jgi:uncharacterized protein (TIGR02217 family)